MIDYGQLMYELKQTYGRSLSVYNRRTGSVDLKTGRLIEAESVYRVARAVVLPLSIFQKYFRHPGIPGFDYGGDLEINQQVFIIERRDLPVGVTINSNDFYIICDHVRFSVAVMQQFDNVKCYYVTGKEVAGTEVSEQITVSLQSWVYVSDSAGRPFSATVSDSINVTDEVS